MKFAGWLSTRLTASERGGAAKHRHPRRSPLGELVEEPARADLGPTRQQGTGVDPHDVYRQRTARRSVEQPDVEISIGHRPEQAGVLNAPESFEALPGICREGIIDLLVVEELLVEPVDDPDLSCGKGVKPLAHLGLGRCGQPSGGDEGTNAHDGAQRCEQRPSRASRDRCRRFSDQVPK